MESVFYREHSIQVTFFAYSRADVENKEARALGPPGQTVPSPATIKIQHDLWRQMNRNRGTTGHQVKKKNKNEQTHNQNPKNRQIKQNIQ